MADSQITGKDFARIARAAGLVIWAIIAGGTVSAVVSLTTLWLSRLVETDATRGNPVNSLPAILHVGKVLSAWLGIITFLGFEALELRYVLRRVKEAHGE